MPKQHLQAVFLDWAGTTVDHGSIAPIQAIANIFSAHGILLELPVVRRYMGLSKQEHVRQLLLSAEARQPWVEKYHREPNDADAQQLYSELGAEFLLVVRNHSAVIGGVPEAIATMRSRGLKIGGTTGYTRQMLEAVAASAKPQGYYTDLSFCPDDVGAGRPFPWMCYRLALELRVYPLWAIVKIGDTEADITEGLNAGMWTIGLTRCGNLVGLAEEEWHRLKPEEQKTRLKPAEETLKRAGAHYLAESVADCLPILDEIETRLSKGDRPS